MDAKQTFFLKAFCFFAAVGFAFAAWAIFRLLSFKGKAKGFKATPVENKTTPATNDIEIRRFCVEQSHNVYTAHRPGLTREIYAFIMENQTPKTKEE